MPARPVWLIGFGVAALVVGAFAIAQTRNSTAINAVENPNGVQSTTGSNQIASGLQNPRGVLVLPDGRLVVVEAGNGITDADASLETGRVSVFEDLNSDGDYDDVGEIQPVVSQIPSYNTLTEFGTGQDEVGGAGDIVSLPDGQMFMTRDDPSEGYAADGSPTGINVAQFALDSGMGANLIVRDATMNSIAYDSQTQVVYVIESGANGLIAVSLDGTIRQVATFAELDEGQQAVPAGVAADTTTGDVLVALFSGQIGDYFGSVLSFLPGASKIVRVNPNTGRQTDEIVGLTTAVDVAVDELGNVFVVELTSVWPSARMPRDFDLFDPNAAPDPGGYARFAGSVTMYPADGSNPIVLANGLDQPTNITHAKDGLYISVGQGTPGRPIIGPDGLGEITGELHFIPLR